MARFAIGLPFAQAEPAQTLRAGQERFFFRTPFAEPFGVHRVTAAGADSAALAGAQGSFTLRLSDVEFANSLPVVREPGSETLAAGDAGTRAVLTTKQRVTLECVRAAAPRAGARESTELHEPSLPAGSRVRIGSIVRLANRVDAPPPDPRAASRRQPGRGDLRSPRLNVFAPLLVEFDRLPDGNACVHAWLYFIDEAGLRRVF